MHLNLTCARKRGLNSNKLHSQCFLKKLGALMTRTLDWDLVALGSAPNLLGDLSMLG